MKASGEVTIYIYIIMPLHAPGEQVPTIRASFVLAFLPHSFLSNFLTLSIQLFPPYSKSFHSYMNWTERTIYTWG